MSTSSFEIISPTNGSLVATVPIQGEAEAQEAVARAREAQEVWGSKSPRERAKGMKRLADVMHARSDELAHRIREETGKPPVEALAELVVSLDLVRYYARIAPWQLRPRKIRRGWLGWKSTSVEREPWGVVGAITPWNYPLIVAMDYVAAALTAGNAIVIKPSEFTPWTTMRMPDIGEEAGLPEGLIQVLTGDGTTGQALVKAGVDRIVFTGSTDTGRRIMKDAADSLTPVSLELGGNDPAIVLEDADLERAARGVLFGATFNAGQTCISVERVYVVRDVYDAFVERVVELASELKVGTEASADVGPLVTEAQLGIVEGQIRDALAKGARVLTGGRRLEGEARLFPPTILVDVDDSMDLIRDETFGPLLPIFAVEHVAEAIEQANRGGYGLFASVWTGDRERGLRAARQLSAGGVSVNDVLSHYAVPGMPMGGQGESGFGRRRGLEGLLEMTRSRSIFADRRGLAREPWWYPYTPNSLRLTRLLLDWRGLGGIRGLLRAAAGWFGGGS